MNQQTTAMAKIEYQNHFTSANKGGCVN